jgi:UDP-N-acetylglucosamine diphosphorylase/glucosamine-1-phosphate N-acetyltransferase
MRLCVFEDSGASNFGPLTLTRPVFDLLCGSKTLLARLQRYFGASDTAVMVRPLLASLCRQLRPNVVINDTHWPRQGDRVLVNARFVPPDARFDQANEPIVGLVGEQVAYVVLPGGLATEFSPERLDEHLEEWKQDLPTREAGGWMVQYPWDLVEHNSVLLERDLNIWKSEHRALHPLDGLTLIGPAERVVIDAEARIEPQVVLDATRGPILVDRGAVVQAFSRLEGPCWIGPNTQVLAARVRGGSIGPQCRVGGEVEASILHGYTNKYHEGFVGHSYIGAWVNFGAGTQISDLRNDYAPITMTIAGRKIPTEQVKIGAYIGDHTRTGIGTLLNTGTVVGPFSQLLPTGSLLPRVVPAFCQVTHGRVLERTDLKQMLSTAAIVLGRRGQEWSEIDTDLFFDLFDETASERRRVIRESEQQRVRRVV